MSAKILIAVSVSFLALLPCVTAAAGFPEESSSDMPFGIPIGGGSEEVDTGLCPAGARVVTLFLSAWEKEDYAAMYDLFDEDSKKDYPFEQARFDLRLLIFKPYKISSIRKDGENFEFMLSHGDWRDGNKDLKKMIISGKTFRIIMPSANSPFKRSAGDYF
ncbi:MAG: hypothetical protein KAS86_04605 [Candidatus Omnitrophica bacterium]|nr:hypothetical protein [Candidatus Omnitrophota bacterium]